MHKYVGTCVLYPSGNVSILLWISAFRAASKTSPSEDEIRPYCILYLKLDFVFVEEVNSTFIIQ